MSNKSNISGDHNIVIQGVKDGTITVNVNGEVQNIRNDLASLKTLLEQQQTQQIQIGEKIYNIGEIGQAEFTTIVNQYLQESSLSRYLRLAMLVVVPLLAIGFAYFWYRSQVLSKPINLSVQIDNRTPNAELPQTEAKISLTYGDKVEALSAAEEVIFKGIPANFRHKAVRVKCEVSGFFVVDTSFVLEDQLLVIPIYRDKSFAELKGNVTLDTSGDEIIPLEGVDVEVQDLHAFTDANGNFSLQIPFAKQRTEQRVILRKDGYNAWDQTVSVMANEVMRVTMRKMR